jgi:hypothetical protein
MPLPEPAWWQKMLMPADQLQQMQQQQQQQQQQPDRFVADFDDE